MILSVFHVWKLKDIRAIQRLPFVVHIPFHDFHSQNVKTESYLPFTIRPCPADISLNSLPVLGDVSLVNDVRQICH